MNFIQSILFLRTILVRDFYNPHQFVGRFLHIIFLSLTSYSMNSHFQTCFGTKSLYPKGVGSIPTTHLLDQAYHQILYFYYINQKNFDRSKRFHNLSSFFLVNVIINWIFPPSSGEIMQTYKSIVPQISMKTFQHFHAHRVIMASASEFFKEALRPNRIRTRGRCKYTYLKSTTI